MTAAAVAVVAVVVVAVLVIEEAENGYFSKKTLGTT